MVALPAAFEQSALCLVGQMLCNWLLRVAHNAFLGCWGAGNFKTLQQAIQEYSADAMRIALADAGDTMDDANFDEKVGNAVVCRMHQQPHTCCCERNMALQGG